MTSLLFLILALLLVAACGFFVAAEFALVTVDRTRVAQEAEAGDRGARGLRGALRALSTHLSGAQLGITLTNLGIGWLSEPAVRGLLHHPLMSLGLSSGGADAVDVVLALVLSSIITMLYGELVPKNVALALPYATAVRTRPVLGVFTRVMTPAIVLLNGSANALVRRLGVEPQEELRSARSSSELSSLIQHSADEGTLDADTAELMERSVEFGTRTAGEIMTPRVRTTSLEETDRASAIIDLARRTGHSRFPVLDEHEAVVGVVHVKSAVALPVHERATTRVRHLMSKPVVVPDSLRLDPLMALLRTEGTQLAIVLDEYGGHAGIVTLEDVIEEIVGDIADEHDAMGSRARLRRDGTWSLSGLLRPDEVEDLTHVALPESEDYDTIAGLVLAALGRIPTRGDVAEVTIPDLSNPDEPRIHQVTLTVEHMDGLRIDRIALRLDPNGPLTGPGRSGDGEER